MVKGVEGYTAIDCFSGPGGLGLGLKRAGMVPLAAIEYNHQAAETYRRNHPGTIMEEADIRAINLEGLCQRIQSTFGMSQVDVVVGGPPCESFSIAGQRRAGDDRDVLFEAMVDVAEFFNAKIILIENVKGMLSKKMKRRTAIEYMIDYLNKCGYRIKSEDPAEFVLRASDYGVPQRRDRLFLVASRDADLLRHFSYPEPTTSDGEVTVEQALVGLPEKMELRSTDNRYAVGYEQAVEGLPLVARDFLSFVWAGDGKTVYNHQAPGHLTRMVERFMYIRPGESQRTAAERLLEEEQDGVDLRERLFPNVLYGARNRRLIADQSSFTVTSHCLDEIVHFRQNRALTPREAARLQSFPDDYEFIGPHTVFHGSVEQDVYEQIGDAIPPMLATAVARQIYRALFTAGVPQVPVNRNGTAELVAGE